MSKTSILIVTVLLLGLLVYYNASKGSNSTNVVSADRNFAVENKDDIGKVFIATKSDVAITLERKGKKWMVNGKYEAEPSTVTNVLSALNSMQIKYIPHRNATENIIREIGHLGIKIEVYNRSNEKMRTFYMGGASQDERATFCLMDGATQPYAMHLPYFEGGLRARFLLKENEFRSKFFIVENPSKIERISVEYPKQKNQSYVLQRNGRKFSVSPLNSMRLESKTDVNQKLAEAYLSDFRKIGAEFYDNENSGRDTIVMTVPFAKVIIHRSDDTQSSYSVYPLKDLVDNYADNKSYKDLQNINRAFIYCSNDDFILAQQRNFKKMLRSYDYFFQ